jgi:hypothetical protein
MLTCELYLKMLRAFFSTGIRLITDQIAMPSRSVDTAGLLVRRLEHVSVTGGGEDA